MRLLDPTYIRDSVDYSFGDQSGHEIDFIDEHGIHHFGYMKLANRSNEEFMAKVCDLMHARKPFMTLFCDNLRLYRREGVKMTAVEQINPHVRGLKSLRLQELAGHDLLELCASIPEMKFVIFTGFEDTPIDEHIYEKIPENVLAIYASNALTFGGKVIPIPYGLQRRLNSYDHRQRILKEMMLEQPGATRPLYLNYNIATNPERQQLNAHFAAQGWATIKTPGTLHDADYGRYLLDIKEHKFVLCPSGNAIGCECHRDWETLYMRRVPVLLRSPYLEYIFRGWPVLFVDSFYDVTPELLSRNNHLYEQMLHIDLSKLDIEYLYSKCLSEISIPKQHAI